MSSPRLRSALLAAALCVASGAFAAWWFVRSLDGGGEQPRPAPVERVPEPVASPARRAVGGPDLAAQAAAPVASDDSLAEQNNAAIAALEAREFDDAIALLEACVRAEPERDVFRRNLAEALARKAVAAREEEHPCASCLELLRRAKELAPDRADIAEFLARIERELEVEKDFYRESSQHFDLSYDGDRDDILFAGNRLLNRLEDHYVELERFFGAAPIEEGRPRIAVSLYRREGFSELTGLGDWAGGAFDGVVRIPIGDFAREEELLDGVMRHELAHAFIRSLGGANVPGWLNEGLAQWLEPGRARSLAGARAKLSGEELFELARMDGSLASWQDPELISRAYAQSLVLIDWIAGRFGETLVVDMVRGCAAATAPAETFERTTRVPLESAFREFVERR
ncbi:MAG: hypothetical protein IT453_13955 [Planctomycetes bacterium]|nr:hypothetical protein [Planctomycetota bacterium]